MEGVVEIYGRDMIPQTQFRLDPKRDGKECNAYRGYAESIYLEADKFPTQRTESYNKDAKSHEDTRRWWRLSNGRNDESYSRALMSDDE